MVKWIFIVVAALSFTWLGLAWYIANQFLSIGISKYEETAELSFLKEANLNTMERRAVEIVHGQTTLAGSFFRHPNPNDCAVIFLPGIGGNRTQVLPALPIFWQFGCHVLAYDLRGTGASSRTLRSFGYFEKSDNAAAIHWLAETTGLSETSIGVWGPSFGAAVGLMTLEELPNISFVIADSTFASFERVARETIAQLSHPQLATLLTPPVLKILEFRTGMVVKDVEPARSIIGSTTPVLLIHALHDPAMAVDHSRVVFNNRTSSNIELEITDWGAGHADSAIIDPVAYANLIRAFLSRHETTRHIVNH